MTIAVKTKIDDRLAATLKPKVRDATIKSLGRAGGTIRLTATRMIRRNKKPSAPGKPPHTQTGRLKKLIRYAVDNAQQNVVVGPEPGVPGWAIWSLHEFGGVGHAKFRKLKQTRFKIGQSGPVRLKPDGKLVRIKLTTQGQVERANRLQVEAVGVRDALARVDKKYPARPFMRPALDRIRPRLPEAWAGSVSN